MKKTLVFKDNFAYLYLNKNIYSTNKIKQSYIEFKDFIKFSSIQIGKYTIVKIENISQDYSLEVLAKEFANFVLAQEQDRQ